MKDPYDEVIDQALHLMLGFLAVVIVVVLGGCMTWAAGAAIGLSLGVTREVTEDGRLTSRGSLRDLTFWTLGGLTGGLVL